MCVCVCVCVCVCECVGVHVQCITYNIRAVYVWESVYTCY